MKIEAERSRGYGGARSAPAVGAAPYRRDAATNQPRLPEPVFPRHPEKCGDVEPDAKFVPSNGNPYRTRVTVPMIASGAPRLALSVHRLAREARRIPSDHFLPVHRMEVQPRLPLLLGLQQRRQGHDRRRSRAAPSIGCTTPAAASWR